ncbi:hypothetical protein ACIP98_21055 [Streptomyces sp. NPDC088354]|uniref:hypothetical protein n=1 Tax=Streptomyces sp. NPDC088354 TaxID=3365856 RepID=UPI0037FD7276
MDVLLIGAVVGSVFGAGSVLVFLQLQRRRGPRKPEPDKVRHFFRSGSSFYRAGLWAHVVGTADQVISDVRDPAVGTGFIMIDLAKSDVWDRPAPDLVEITQNEDTGAAVRQLAGGFDTLFRALGPPPDGLAGLEPMHGGGGGTER